MLMATLVVIFILFLLLLVWVTDRHSQKWRLRSSARLKAAVRGEANVQVREMHVISNVAWFLTTIQRSDQ